jgi:hypothetical protein
MFWFYIYCDVYVIWCKMFCFTNSIKPNGRVRFVKLFFDIFNIILTVHVYYH